MKRTSSMKYQPSEASRELVLYATNDGRLYNGITTSIINNLHKKYIKGTYDSSKAIDLWYSLSNQASNAYSRDFGYKFSVQERFTAAVEFEDYYKELVMEG